MTTVSALPPSTAPAKGGGSKAKSASEGGDDFAAMLAGMAGAATPATAPVAPENGAPAGGLPGAPILVLDLSQLDAAAMPAQVAPVVLPTQVAGQLAGQALPAPVAAPTLPVAETAAVAALVDAAPAAAAPAAVPAAAAAVPAATAAVPAAAAAVPAAAAAVPDVAAAVTAVTTPTAPAAQPAAAAVAAQPATDPNATDTPAAAAADVVAEVAPTGTAGTPATAKPTTPSALQAPAAGHEADTPADVTPTGQEGAADASGEQSDAPLPQSAPAPVETVRSSTPASAETFGPAPVTESRSVTAPAAPVPAAPAAPAPPPATQVVTQLAPLFEGPDGAYTMSLQLYPEELGMVKVEVSLRGGEISLALHTTDEASRELLRNSLAQLREQLEATGLTATDVSVDSDAREEDDPASPQQSGTRGGGSDGDGAADAAPALPTDPDAALDVRI